MSSRACRYAMCVADHGAVDDVGQATLQTPHGLHAGLAVGELAPVMGATLGVVTQWHDGHDVQEPVDPAVARPRQPMAALVARGRLQRCGAVPGGEAALVGEPADVTDITE